MTSPGYRIRHLSPADVPLMNGMLAVFGEAFDDIDTYTAAMPSETYLSQLLGKEHFIAIEALIGEHVVGGIAAYVLDKFEPDRCEVYIYDLTVIEAHRRRGVATGMIEALKGFLARATPMSSLCRPTCRMVPQLSSTRFWEPR